MSELELKLKLYLAQPLDSRSQVDLANGIALNAFLQEGVDGVVIEGIRHDGQ